MKPKLLWILFIMFISEFMIINGYPLIIDHQLCIDICQTKFARCLTYSFDQHSYWVCPSGLKRCQDECHLKYHMY